MYVIFTTLSYSDFNNKLHEHNILMDFTRPLMIRLSDGNWKVAGREISLPELRRGRGALKFSNAFADYHSHDRCISRSKEKKKCSKLVVCVVQYKCTINTILCLVEFIVMPCLF